MHNPIQEDHEVTMASTVSDLRGALEILAVDGDQEGLDNLYWQCRYMQDKYEREGNEDVAAIYSAGRKLAHIYAQAISYRLKGRIADAMSYETRAEHLQPEFDKACLSI